MGYDGEPVVVFEETDPADFPRARLLELLDRYRCLINIKGGSRNWAPRAIYFTSNFPPTMAMEDTALARRVTEIRHFPDWLAKVNYVFTSEEDCVSLNGSTSE